MKLRARLVSWLLRGVHPRDPLIAEWLGFSNSTAAGVSVTADSAMRVAAVYSCIRVLSETLAGLPLILYRRKKGGGKERATDHWLYHVLHRSPNNWMTSFSWREMSMIHLGLRGVAYSRVLGNRATGSRQLIPIHPDRVRVKLIDEGRFGYEVMLKNGGTQFLEHEEMLRIPFMTADGVTPITPIQCQRETIGASIASQDYSSRFWANDARPTGGWVEIDGAFRDDDAQKKFERSWQSAMTGENRHKTPFLPRGMKYNPPTGLTMEDAQFIETRKMQRSEIAGIWRVPPHMIGDLERATFSNVEQQSIDFVVYTMQPWLARWEQELSRGLLNPAEQEEYFVEFLVDGLLRGDATARANYFRTAVTTGWMNRNEVREIENMNRAEGLDEFLTPLNMSPADLLAETIKGKLQK